MVYAIFLGHFCWGLVYSLEHPILDDRSRAARPGPGGSCVFPEQWVVLLVVLCGAAGCSGGGTSPSCRGQRREAWCVCWMEAAGVLSLQESVPPLLLLLIREGATVNLIPSVK